jgi:uncharacterized LabA/DUF88 family protein
MPATAILVDGGYFLKRYPHIFARGDAPERVAANLFTMCIGHFDLLEQPKSELYRIFFYDCPPVAKKIHHPLTGRAIDLSKSNEYTFRTQLHSELKRRRKVALRLGRLDERAGGWVIRPGPTKLLLAGRIRFGDLREEDVSYEMRQKGVDMRIGLDIAALAFKRLAGRVILVSGDADFVPAAKLARREGIDFILDPMWQRVSDDLFEHIDGLQSSCRRPPAP